MTTPDMLDLSASPAGALSWKIGPSGPVGPDGYRLPAEIWCAVGAYRDSEAAHAAWRRPEPVMPFLSSAVESWHAVLAPFAHKGECNHLDRNQPGPVFEVGSRKAESFFDRSSFTRFRILESSGLWNGRDPLQT